METLFSWIQLSDLQFGRADAEAPQSRGRTTDRLLQDVLETVERGQPSPDAILVTGDVAYRGDVWEYERAAAWLLELGDALELGPEDIFVVPGNHDVGRAADEDRATARLLQALREGGDSLDNALARPADRALLAKRQASFLDFALGFAPACDGPEIPATERLFWVHRRYVRGLWVRLIGLNTALLSTGEDRGKLRVGEQIARSVSNPPVESDELVIVLGHHPLRDGWLADEPRAAAWLENRAHVHLSGHVHDAESDADRIGAPGPFVRVSVGEGHAPAAPGLGYAFAAVARDESGPLALRVWPRRRPAGAATFQAGAAGLLPDRPFAEHDLRLRPPPPSSRPPSATGLPAAGDPRFEGPFGDPAEALPRFTGREMELASLRAALTGESEVVAVIAPGLGGTGKTALVVELVAREGATLFPAGVAWIDAADLPGDLARAARRFGWSRDRLPTLDEAAAFLAAELVQQRALVVIDNVDPGEIDVERLPLPGGKSRTLMISRAAGLPAALPIPADTILLERLRPAVTRALLRAALPDAGASPDEALDALGALLGHLPLALGLLIPLASAPGATAAALLSRLEHRPLGMLDLVAKGLDRGLAAAFLASFEDLSDTQRKVVLAVAACARATREDVVAAVAHVDEDTASAALGALAGRGLVDRAARGDRPIRMHDALRLFARRQEGSALADAAHLSFARSHVQRHEGDADRSALDRQLPEALSAVDRLIAAGEGEAAWSLLDKVQPHLIRRGRHADLLERLARLVDLLPEESQALSAVLGHQGLCHRLVDELDEAIACHERALAIEERQNRPRGQAQELGNLGLCHKRMGDLPAAIECHEKSAALYERLGRLKEQAIQLGHAGLGYVTGGDVKRAVDYLEQALAIGEKTGHLEGQAIQLGNLGICYRSLGDVEKAVQHHRRSLALNERLGRLDGQANQLASLGLCHEELGEIPKAVGYLERALTLCWRMGLADDHPRVVGVVSALGRLAPGR